MEYNLGIIFGYSETNPKLTQGHSGVEHEYYASLSGFRTHVFIE